MEYEGWKYIYNRETTDGNILRVIPNKEIARPKTFFKYYALTENSVDALTGTYVYATHPNQFNDPLDCYEDILDFSESPEEILNTLYGDLYSVFLNFYGKGLRAYTPKAFRTLFYRRTGVVSLSTSCDNIVMWANYANHSGFCVEFDIDCFPFLCYGPFPVHYVKELPSIKVGRDLQEATLLQTNLKLDVWKYEDEWRLLVSSPLGFDFTIFDETHTEIYESIGKHDRKMRLPLNAIKSVTLGYLFLKGNDIECVQISDYECQVLSRTENLRTRLMDFLAAAKLPVHIMTLDNEKIGRFNYIKAEIIKLKRLTYRLIEIEQ